MTGLDSRTEDSMLPGAKGSGGGALVMVHIPLKASLSKGKI